MSSKLLIALGDVLKLCITLIAVALFIRAWGFFAGMAAGFARRMRASCRPAFEKGWDLVAQINQNFGDSVAYSSSDIFESAVSA